MSIKSAERICMIAARSEGILTDFIFLFLIRWGLKYIGFDYVYCQPFLDQVSPPFEPSSIIQYPLSTLFYGSMYFISGLPELIFAIMWLIYGIITLTLFGRTLGMRVSGIALVDYNFHKPRLRNIIIRQLLAPFSSIALIGYLPMIFMNRTSALHDVISRTRVAYAEQRLD